MPKWIFQKISGDQQGDSHSAGLIDFYITLPYSPLWGKVIQKSTRPALWLWHYKRLTNPSYSPYHYFEGFRKVWPLKCTCMFVVKICLLHKMTLFYLTSMIDKSPKIRLLHKMTLVLVFLQCIMRVIKSSFHLKLERLLASAHCLKVQKYNGAK